MNIVIGSRIKKASSLVSVFASVVAFVLSVLTFIGFRNGLMSYAVADWIAIGGLSVRLGVTIDALTCLMLLVVTIVGTLIQIYSIGYMHDDKRFSRFFAYMSLFMGSMLGLLLADNFVVLMIFWEGVGVCSYLLISFWFEKPSAARAGLKAFVTTRIGDTGMLLGMLLLLFAAKTLYFSDLAELSQDPSINQNLLVVAAFLIFCGAVGKSAQFPLHVWLPDAMEGPTPVSALIHAATMVAAGVYLVARSYALFIAHQPSLIWVAYIGSITALMAATIAVVNNDIKRILAYSTISQLGLMMVGLGVGGFTAGTFHLMTHAFFKALLFLCAGSVIHAVHTQDIREMGGLLSKLKITGATFIVGSLAIAGVPPLAGFWSKDELLAEIWKNGHPVLFVLATVTSFLTAFYMFRLIFLVLFGKTRSELHPHESPAVMTVPLSILAFCSIFGGFLGSPLMHNWFQGLVHFGETHAVHAEGPNYAVMGISVLVGLGGIGLAYLLYMTKYSTVPGRLCTRFAAIHRLLVNKYYFDELYDVVFVRTVFRLSSWLSRFDLGVVDGAVNAVAWITMFGSYLKAWFDLHVVDGAVNLVAAIVGFCSAGLRRLQTGLVQAYLLIAFVGLIIIILVRLKGG